MDGAQLGKGLVKQLFKLRIPSNPLYRALAYEYQARRLALDELQRIFYFQPMFESRCASVGEHFRLELTPDSKFPSLSNVELRLGRDVRMSARTSFSGARRALQTPVIEIGDETYIGHRCTLRAGTGISIGKHVLIATNGLLSGDPGHPLDAIERRTQPAPLESLGRIVIEDDVWLAYNVTILGNVTLGTGAVIAANTVVTRDVPAHALVAGNPGKVLRLLKPAGTTAERLSHAASALRPELTRPGSGRSPINPQRGTGPSARRTPQELRADLRNVYEQLFLAPGETLDAEGTARVDALIDSRLGDSRLGGSRLGDSLDSPQSGTPGPVVTP